MTQAQTILTWVVLPALAVAELCILFWRKRPRSAPPPLPRKRRGPLDIPLPWRPTTMFLTALIGGFLYIVTMAYLEPEGLNPFALAPAHVDRMTLLPENYQSLVDSDVELTRQEIDVVCRTLHAATPISPNHPGTEWQCKLRVIDTAGEVLTVDLCESGGPSNGFLIDWWSPNMRLNKGTHRCDALAPLIKAMVESRKAEPEN